MMERWNDVMLGPATAQHFSISLLQLPGRLAAVIHAFRTRRDVLKDLRAKPAAAAPALGL